MFDIIASVAFAIFLIVGAHEWYGYVLRRTERHETLLDLMSRKANAPPKPKLSEILAMIGDAPLKVNRLRVRVRWPEKYWTRS